jgi:octaprenyl-diphosphate synthase
MSEHSSVQADLSRNTETTDPVLDNLVRVTYRHRVGNLADRLAALRDWLQDDLSELDDALGRVVAMPTKDIAWDAARYLLEQSGKRVRPLCVMLGARMGGRAFDDDIRQVAIAAELVHTATLLHDDVIDQGAERRGVSTSRMVYGNAASVLGGDHLLIDALRRVGGIDHHAMSQLLTVIADMVSAEALQLEMRKSFRPDREIYLKVVEGKTAALFSWALEAGGRLGGLDAALATTLGEVGRHLGMTFQLIDDLLDVEGDPEEMGKMGCLDLAEGKLTWPTILAAERCPETASLLKEIATDHIDLAKSNLQDVVARIHKTGAIEDTRAEARRYAELAMSKLDSMPIGPSRDALNTVVESALRRTR